MLQVISHDDHEIDYLVSLLKEMDAETKGKVDWRTKKIEKNEKLGITKVSVKHSKDSFSYTRIL